MAGTVLVTGGSGYIAGFTIREAIARGWTVRATIRSLARETEIRKTLAVDDGRLSFHAADLMSDTGWAEAIAGCSHVLHMASPLPATAPKHEDELIVPAREGALRALRFARDAGVKRVVMTSSVAAIQYGVDRGVHHFDESHWTNLAHPDVYAYPKSKTIAERAARDWMAAEGGALELVTINPSVVLGPLMSRDFSTSIELVKKLLDGSMPGTPDLGFSIVDVRDLAALHVKVLDAPGIAGGRFIASGRFMKLHDVAEVLRSRLGVRGRKVPKRKLPDFVVKLVAMFDPVTRQVAGEVGKVRHLDPSHTRDTLGWETRPPEQSIVDTAESLFEHGVLKA